jgi:GxxExxY protein
MGAAQSLHGCANPGRVAMGRNAGCEEGGELVSGGESNYDLAGQVIGLAMKVHSLLGPGFPVSVYQNALVVELKQVGFSVEVEKQLDVMCEGEVVGNCFADMVINGELIVENEAVGRSMKSHEVQLVNYLTCSGVESVLLLTFGEVKLEVRRKYRRR